MSEITNIDDAELQAEAAALREQAAKHEQEAADSFERCDTDGFVSQWASGLNAQKARIQAGIVENGGKAEFVGLFDRETGERVRARLVKVAGYNYGTVSKWVVLDAADNAVAWVPAFKTGKQSKLYKLGFEERYEMAAAVADIGGGSGRGLSGAASCYAMARRTDGGFGADAVIWKGA
jgi:hypothetical protein